MIYKRARNFVVAAKARLWSYFSSGINSDSEQDLQRNVILLNLVAIVGVCVLCSMATLELVQKQPYLAITLIIPALVLVLLAVYLRLSRSYIMTQYIGFFSLGIFFLFLLILGDFHRVLFIWSFLFPVTATFLLGSRSSILVSMIFFGCANAAFWRGLGTPLHDPLLFIIRYDVMYLSLFTLSAFIERTKEFFQKKLQVSNDELQAINHQNEVLIRELRQANSEVALLRGIIPICANCKKIHNDKGTWEQIESYVSKRTDAKFSHGVCPPCYEDLYPNLAKTKKGCGAPPVPGSE